MLFSIHMKKSFFILLFLSGFYAQAQNIEVIKFSDLDRLIKEKSSEHRIFNFWATWCKPCIAELPYFEEVNKKYGDKVKVYLISLDFVEDLNSKVSSLGQYTSGNTPHLVATS